MAKYFFNTSQGGLVLSSEAQYPNGNALGSTAQYCFLLPKDHPDWRRLCMGMAEYEVVLGCFSRWLDHTENTSIDDYLSAGCLRDFASYLLRYGRKTWGFFDATNPYGKWRFKQWLWRFPGFWPHLKLAACEPLNLYDRLAWSVSVLYQAIQGIPSSDAVLQTFLMCEVLNRSGRNYGLMKLSSRLWKNGLKKFISTYYAEYCGDDQHPLVVLLKQYD